MAKFKWKRGDTLEMAGKYLHEGVPYDLSTVEIESQLRMADGTKVDDFVVTKLDQTEHPGEFTLVVEDTSEWPLVELKFDIEYRFGSTVVSTETNIVHVIEDITR